MNQHIQELKFKLAYWLCPGLFQEVDRLRWITEANHDIHILHLAYNPTIIEQAFLNAKNFEPAIMSHEKNIVDRQASLIEILRRMSNNG